MRILSTGVYAPGEALSHQDVMDLAGVEFDGERISQKLGIYKRHIAHLRGIEETTADFAEEAARRAIAAAGISAEEVDLFIVGTDTPEHISPATSMLVQGRIQGGQKYTGAFDVVSSCASFVTALHNAQALLKSDSSLRYACVIGVYNMPAYFRPGDVFGYSIFADGAGAVILENSGDSYLGGQLLADGTQWNYIGVYSGGTKQPVTAERLEKGEYGLQLLQRLPGDRNVKLWPEVADTLLKKCGLTQADVDHYLFTQINRQVIWDVMDALQQDRNKTSWIMDRYGYTGSACIPMALHHAVLEGKIKRGDKVMMIASGAGLAVAASLLTY